MDDFKIKRKREIDLSQVIRPIKFFITIFGALLIICLATGAKVLTFKHVIIFSICSIPLCILFAYSVEKLGSGLGGILSGWTTGNISPRERLSADLEKARYSKSKGEFEEAFSIINGVIDKDPDFPDALYLKGQILWEGFENGEEAIRCFRKVMGLLQNTEPLHRWASSYYYKIKE
jgi:tetratricopeptide (TPR) repeat protein